MNAHWKISKLDRLATDGLVVKVHYVVCSSLDEFATRLTGSVNLSRSDSFVAYENLKEDEVIDWVKSALGQQGVESKEIELQAKIQETKSPTIVSGVPWA